MGFVFKMSPFMGRQNLMSMKDSDLQLQINSQGKFLALKRVYLTECCPFWHMNYNFSSQTFLDTIILSSLVLLIKFITALYLGQSGYNKHTFFI